MGARILILACGNPLRSDDGVAWHAAELLRASCPFARVVAAHQLTPEFAEMAAGAEGVLFLDAGRDGEPGEIACAEVSPNSECSGSSHWFTPAQLIALCDQLYGTHPRGMTLSIAGASFDHGDMLSEAVRGALPDLIEQAKVLLRRLAGSPEAC